MSVESPQSTEFQPSGPSLLARNEFLIRRLHSLSGLIPVGAYMVVHLLTNATVLEGARAFQINVYGIHSLGKLLPVVEWGFIFLPLLFHAIIGIVIIQGGLPNSSNYPLGKNIRYVLQRATGMIAFFFILWHVFHLHGWIHADWWIKSIAKPMGGAQFKPYNAASTAGAALQSWLVAALYAVGVLACVFHLANGMWTMGITWGVWTSEAAQKRADKVCIAFGIGLAFVGLSALFGMRDAGNPEHIQQTIADENLLYDGKVETGVIEPAPEKRSAPSEETSEETNVADAAPEAN